MGISSDGILAYGFKFASEDDGDEVPWSDEKYDGDPDEWVDEIGGTVLEEWREGMSRDEGRAWGARNKAARDVTGIGVDNCCHGDYPVWCIVASGSRERCSRGYPVEQIDLAAKVAQTAEFDAKIRAFCDKAGIDLAGSKVGWMFMSYMG